jgi:hypothetical protein
MHNVVYVCGQAVKKYLRMVVLEVHSFCTNARTFALLAFVPNPPVALHTFCTQFIRTRSVLSTQLVLFKNRQFTPVTVHFYPLSTALITITTKYI